MERHTQKWNRYTSTWTLKMDIDSKTEGEIRAPSQFWKSGLRRKMSGVPTKIEDIILDPKQYTE